MMSGDFLCAPELGTDFSDADLNMQFVSSEEAAKEADDIKEIKTCCRACISRCGVIATVKNGQVTELRGNPEDPMAKGHLCAKGLSGLQALYNPNRNKYPMIRVGERGENKWKRISWDEAFDIISDKLLEAKKEYGAETVLGSTGGGGNPQFFSIARFMNIFGSPNWFEPGSSQCYLPRSCTYQLMYGGTNPSIADSNSKEIYYAKGTKMNCLVLWGTDPSYSSPACGGAALAALRAEGVKTVVIDPRMTPDAAKADIWLQIRPGTDVALEMAWINYIIQNKLYDYDFVLKWTNLPYLVNTETKLLKRGKLGERKYMLNMPGDPDEFYVYDKKSGEAKVLSYPWNDDLDVELDCEVEIDGVLHKTGFRLLRERMEEWTVEKAAEICWLDPKMVEDAINMYAKNTPGGIAIGVATDHSPNSSQAAQCACTLDALMGNVEKPGTCLQRFLTSGVTPMGDFNIMPATDKLAPEQVVKRLGGNEYKGMNLWKCAHAPTIIEAMETGKPYPIRVWLERSGNKWVNVADGQRWVKAAKNIPFIVHMYMYPTSFSAYADMLLPTEEWLETDMIVENCNKILARQATTHLYETMDESMIWSMLCKRLGEKGDEGCRMAFDKEYMGINKPYWNSMEEILDYSLAPAGITFKQLKEEGVHQFCTEEEYRRYYVYKNPDPSLGGKPTGFITPSRKMEIYFETWITLSRTGAPLASCPLPPASHDYDPLPFYMEPVESPIRDDEISKKFPLVMTNGRVPFFHHGTLRNVPYMREIYPAPEVWVNPADAKKYGIEHNSWVWVESLRGKVRGIANITAGIGEGCAYMERFWAPENLDKETHGWMEMNVSKLARSQGPYNEVYGTYTLRGFQVKIYPAPEGAPEGVWLTPKEFKGWLPEVSEPSPDTTKETAKGAM
ncbi:MAG: molybdopterin-dependent oxidoreductase [Eubacterium sp.]|nr:molybdopterin-dependent oxidoreductase [Eubacterium sp.]